MPAPLRIPHTLLSDAEWAALSPYVLRASRGSRGRPCDHRARFDAIFRVAATDGPWHELPESHGKPDTVSRYFRRLTHQGLWEHLLLALAAAPKGHPLKNLLGPICRAARRAIRLRGFRIILLARRLELKRALPGPPWMCPDPDLSEKLFDLQLARLPTIRGWPKQRAFTWLRAMRKCLTVVAGRRYIPRALKACWP
ncbi:transposase [Roseococcus sp. SYP-B2431]|uniref:transposase n=1 Tax=Roseococcus sp. SYP-B2431 TaxID=2496640 RepID=UPI00103987B9|nr:transposase [Roseococcus sp. SYP-B2431]TCH96580.1 transposase [Roseococcus sp. SYP-B2431]